MATGDYCNLNELKKQIYPDNLDTDTVNDIALQQVITAASRWIDNYCGRRFYSTSADETKTFTPQDGEYLFLPHIDILSVTTLKTDEDGDRTYETTWATTDYDLLPEDGPPYSYIAVAPQGDYSFPEHRKAVQIVGLFGYNATNSQPAAVRQACMLLSERLWKRRDAPLGLVANPAGGDIRLIDSIDPDVEALLSPYRRVL